MLPGALVGCVPLCKGWTGKVVTGSRLLEPMLKSRRDACENCFFCCCELLSSPPCLTFLTGDLFFRTL